MDHGFAKRIPGAKTAYFGLVRVAALLISPWAKAKYLAAKGPKKLHIGGGVNRLPGWLNTDLVPTRVGVVRLDATKHFPFPDDVFDYAFSEHMIEHVPYADGLQMLREIHRVMKPGGKVRITTPDLGFLVALFAGDKNELQTAYIKWSSDMFIGNGEYTDTMIINNFMRNWGHTFIYDRKTLTRAFHLCGFAKIEAFDINQSNDPELAHLETEARMPPGFLRLESFTLEATKPGADRS